MELFDHLEEGRARSLICLWRKVGRCSVDNIFGRVVLKLETRLGLGDLKGRNIIAERLRSRLGLMLGGDRGKHSLLGRQALALTAGAAPALIAFTTAIASTQ
jgi:hypothetical protein